MQHGALALLTTVALTVSSPATADQLNGTSETAKSQSEKANKKDLPGKKTEPGKELEKAEPDAKKKPTKPEAR